MEQPSPSLWKRQLHEKHVLQATLRWRNQNQGALMTSGLQLVEPLVAGEYVHLLGFAELHRLATC
jgi:hypothetical protein